MFTLLIFASSTTIFILLTLLPALIELKKPKDAGPKIVASIIPPHQIWHVGLINLEPFIPEMVDESIGVNSELFGLEELINIETSY